MLKKIRPGVKTIILTSLQDPEHIIDAFEAGAAGYLGRDATLEELVVAINRVMKGETAVAPKMSETILGQYARVKKSREKRNTLKEEHISILRYAGRGLSNKEIAEKLNVTIDSVKSRLKSIFSKLSAKDRTHAVSEAIRLGLISMD
jgi:DNA-binding NarL/FixJ family response regulator